MRTWSVQTRGEDGLFRTIENGTHTSLSTAYAQYEAIEGVAQLVRNDVIVLRTDQPVTEPASHDALF